MLNETHDPALRSWVESANAHDTDFPIQNLPFAIFRRRAASERYRGGVAIGDRIVDLAAALHAGLFDGLAAVAARAATVDSLNALMALGPAAASALRSALSRQLREKSSTAERLGACLVAQADAEYAMPATIGDFTDFFTSYHHMLNAGRVFQPDSPPLPNFKWLPIAYHGRASSVALSGTAVRRPNGQTRVPGEAEPRFGPTRRLDYELELGVFVGPGNARGESIAVDVAEQHVFGLCLLNDWSARDVQGWESMPLGPFLAKNFLTSISPWIVTLEALAPFRRPLPRAGDDPPELPNLRHREDAGLHGIDIQLEAWIETPHAPGRPMRLSRTSFRHCHWSIAQMLTHHTEGGCNLRPGDLLGTGTQSGPGEGEQGCLLELSRGGNVPVVLPNGELRSFLEDGDTLTLRGWCERSGWARIGFGVCEGQISAAQPEAASGFTQAV